MDTKIDIASFETNIVYVKPILAADLPLDVREKVGDL